MTMYVVAVAISTVVFFGLLLIAGQSMYVTRSAYVGQAAAKAALALFFASIFLPAAYGAELFGTMTTGATISLLATPNGGVLGVMLAFGYILAPISWIIVHVALGQPSRAALCLAAFAALVSAPAAAYFLYLNGWIIDRFLAKSKIPAYGSLAWLTSALVLAIVWISLIRAKPIVTTELSAEGIRTR